tara:strand:+ start:1402 stop:1980 length:579 start_codon:yes stop_codon:yes gene_type:complete
MSYVLFVSEQRLKETTAITSNVDVEFLLPYLKIAQRKYIETTLGTKLFERLQADIAAGSLSGDYATLVNDHVSDALCHFAFYEALPFMHYKIMNKAVMLKSSDNASPITREELQDIRSNVRDTAEWYNKRIIKYITNNTASFPEYSTNTGDDISPSKSAYSSAMNLDKRIQGLDRRRPNITLDDFLTADLKY